MPRRDRPKQPSAIAESKHSRLYSGTAEDVLALLVLAFIVAAAYCNIFSNEFLFDDEFLIQKNMAIRSWDSFFQIFRLSSEGGAGGVSNFYRPLQNLLYLVTYQAFGLSTSAFHAVNLFLHLGNVVVVYLIALAFGAARPWAFLITLLWGLHPLHTEAVTYMSATADPLHTLFCLLACLWTVRNVDHPRRQIPAYIFAACALLSKEAAVVIPGLVLIVHYVKSLQKHLAAAKPALRQHEVRQHQPLRRQMLWTSFKVSLPYWAIVTTYLVARATILNFRNTFHLYATDNIYTEHILYRIYTFWATLPAYLAMIVFPHDLHMERSFSVFIDPIHKPVLCGLLLFAGLVIAGVQGFRKNRPLWILAGFWPLAAHFPQSGVLVPANAFVLEHWMYLPTLGAVWATAGALTQTARFKSPHARHFVWAVVGCVALTLGFLTFEQNRVWSNPIIFYNHILKYTKGTLRVHNNLGMAYSDRNDYPNAITQYETAIAMDPKVPNPIHNLGTLYLQMGRIDDAIAQFEKAVAVDPQFYYALNMLADVYEKTGHPSKAAEYRARFQEVRDRVLRGQQ